MIRKFMISFLGTALVMSMFVGCHHKPTVQELGIVLDTLRADTIAALSDSAAQPHCEVHLQLLTFADKKYAPLNDSLLHSDILSPQYLSLGSKVFIPKEAVDSFIQRYIEDDLADEIIKADILPGDTIRITADEEHVFFDIEKGEASKALDAELQSKPLEA